MREHRLVDAQTIASADFWTPAQAAFIMEAISDGADWSELFDRLNAALRHKFFLIQRGAIKQFSRLFWLNIPVLIQ